MKKKERNTMYNSKPDISDVHGKAVKTKRSYSRNLFTSNSECSLFYC